MTGDGRQAPESSRVVMWDTGVKCGDLGAHARKKVSLFALMIAFAQMTRSKRRLIT